MNVELLTGDAALGQLRDARFCDAWHTLWAACPWATGFQRSGFVLPWFEHYGDLYEPILIMARDAGGKLAGMLPLAARRGSGRVVVAGDWQAEYHAWLARPDDGDAFILAAVDAARRACGRGTLRFRYLPPGAPLGWLGDASLVKRHALTPHAKPIYAIGDGADARASLKKSGNKRRLKMLLDVGPVSLEHVTEPAIAAGYLDELIPMHDARHAAVRGSTPFRNDPRKRAFQLSLLSDPDLLHLTVLRAGTRVVAGHLGVRTGGELQLGILAHDPTLARASPGKFLHYHLALRLVEQGMSRIDLTAGGEAYKDRFANDHDTVHALDIYGSRARHALATASGTLTGRARRLIDRAGIAPPAVEAWVRSVATTRHWKLRGTRVT